MVGVYLGGAKAADWLIKSSIPFDLAVWLSNLPKIAGYFIQGSMDLLVVGVCVILMGRAIRWYFEHDIKLLRNAALIVSIVWSRWILEGTSAVLTEQGSDPKGMLIFYVIVGILIGIASGLVVLVIHRSARGFFEKTEEQVEEFGKG